MGVASGIQEKFSWKGVALAALSGGIGAGLSAPGSVFAKLGLSGQNAIAAGARGAISSAAVQGVAVATGLQGKFDWAGVAAAGIGAGVGHFAGKNLFGAASFQETRSFSNVAANTLTGSARAIANAATRSAIQGTSFGDNVMRALPDALGQTIGELIAATAQGPSFAQRIKSLSSGVRVHLPLPPDGEPGLVRASGTEDLNEYANCLDGAGPCRPTSRFDPKDSYEIEIAINEYRAAIKQYGWRSNDAANLEDLRYGLYVFRARE